jgi:hypothetical protein
MEEKVSMDLPVKLNLLDMVTVKPYKDSPEYIEAKKIFLKKVETKKTIKRTINIVLWLILTAYLVNLVYTGHTFLVWIAGIFGAIICGIVSFANSPNSVSSYFNISKEDDVICRKIINELIETNFPESKFLYLWNRALIYNNNIFAYMSLDENLLIVYSRNNLKQISWKFLPDGVNGRELPAYSVEVCTDYQEYPNFKFCIPGYKEFLEQLKVACSVLS